MQGNQEVYIQRVLEFEAHVVRGAQSFELVSGLHHQAETLTSRHVRFQSTHLEQARGAEQTAETTIRRLEAVRVSHAHVQALHDRLTHPHWPSGEASL